VLERNKISKIWRTYFPKVKFNPFNTPDEMYIEEIPEEIYAILKDCRDDNGHLEISRMARKAIFKPLFPKPAFMQENEAALKKARESAPHPNVIKYFISKYDEKFAARLNEHLEEKDRIAPGKTLTNKFDLEVLKDGFCEYSMTTKDNGDLKAEFVWVFPGYAFSHQLNNSVYKAFRCYAKKNCTLYLLGAEFMNFKNRPESWPRRNEHSLPVYFSKANDISKGLGESFKSVNAGDFAWRQGSGWKEDDKKRYPLDLKRHLLKLFKLDEDIDVSLKNIYHSFCIPLLSGKNRLETPEETCAIEYGNHIIDNTLKRNINLAKGQISKYSVAWLEIINEILETTPDTADEYSPTKFETFILQIAGQAYFVKEKALKLEACEGGALDHNDRQNIRNYLIKMNTIRWLLPEEEQKPFANVCEKGDAYDKTAKLYKLMSFEEVRDAFQAECPMIEAMYRKAFTVPMETYEKKGGESEYYPKEIEDTKQVKIEHLLVSEKQKELVLECFKEEFTGENEKKWLLFIQEEDPGILFSDLRSYPPRSEGRQPTAINSNLFKKYREVLHITFDDARNRNMVHTGFAEKMRNITDSLEKKLNDSGN